MSVYEDYSRYVKKYQAEYGSNTVVLYELGSFYEVYSANDNLVDIQTIGNVLNIQVTKKNKGIEVISASNCYMCGFPSPALSKFMGILLQNNYTVVVVQQVTPPPKPKRAVTEVRSPGTKFEDLHPGENNYIMAAYVDEFKDMRSHKSIVSVGLSFIDVSTGDSYAFESHGAGDDSFRGLDDAYSIISNHNPKECLVFGNVSTIDWSTLVQKLGLTNKQCLHEQLNTFDKEVLGVAYQTQVLRKVFPNHGLLSPIESVDLDHKPHALISYVTLLRFVNKHSEFILNKIQKPTFLCEGTDVKLSYNCSKQLNLLPSDNCEVGLVDVLNKCKTAIGRRRFVRQLLNPTSDTVALNHAYDVIDHLTCDAKYKSVRESLSNVCDIERHFRKLLLGRIHPMDFLNLRQSLVTVKELMGCNTLEHAFTGDPNIQCELKEILTHMTMLRDDAARKYLIDAITENIFVEGYSEALDNIQACKSKNVAMIGKVCSKLNALIGHPFFKVEQNERDGYHLTITAKRFKLFQACNNDKTLKIDDQVAFEIHQVTTKPLSASSTIVKVEHPIFIDCNHAINKADKQLKEQVGIEYRAFMALFSTLSDVFHRIVGFVGTVDVATTNAHNAVTFGYCRPNIQDSYDKKSFVIANGIRHPIIELTKDDVGYVKNDIQLGTPGHDGMLLYGVNAAGKSSLMKSVGMNIVMASAGMFVPCTSFIFYPYKAVFARIPNGDNISNGHSTFTNEVSELRSILKRADMNSLVIGDELCSGTESVSAMSIVSAGIVTLSLRRTSFIFATHLHDLTKISKLKTLDNLGVFHLSVVFDERRNKLIYDRTLKPGQGTTLYGLEVLRSLDVDTGFITLANEVRHELLGTDINIVSTKRSRYNSKLYKSECAVCKKPSTEVHHIQEQHTADSNGLIGHIHKNALHNLVNVCDSCHDDIHSGRTYVKGFANTSFGRELLYDKII
jgi:DNA mismatch repair protein MutS